MLIESIIFNEISYITNTFINHTAITIPNLVEYLLPNRYFVTYYCIIYFISPYLNILYKNIINKKKFIFIIFIIFSIYSFSIDILKTYSTKYIAGLSPVSLLGNDSGYNIVNFILLYFLGSYIALDYKMKEKNRVVLFSVGLLITNFVLSSIEMFVLKNKTPIIWNYNNPLLILFALSVLVIFNNIKLENNLISKLSKATYTCYLIHQFLLRFIGIKYAAQSNVFFLMIHQLLFAIIIYLICYIVSLIYNKIDSILLTRLYKKVDDKFIICDS